MYTQVLHVRMHAHELLQMQPVLPEVPVWLGAVQMPTSKHASISISKP